MKSKPKVLVKMGRPPKLSSVQRVVHVALTVEQDAWLGAEWHRRGLETRVDVIRAILDEAMMPKD